MQTTGKLLTERLHTNLLPGILNDQNMPDPVLVVRVLVELHPEPLQLDLLPALPGPVHLGRGEGGHGADDLERGVGLVSVGVPGSHRGQV